MDRGSIQSIGLLKVGDRFCFIKERHKEIACEIISNAGRTIMYQRSDKTYLLKARDTEEKVIFLRSSNMY
jgi:hypothetical protein